ncbi:MAG TPA: hypothetical protein VES89_06725 [Candidatus Competibacteraceae bacterium]|nr:hypothetical protein [Candidatus Competibacteraceae bacterium]
MVVVEKSIRQLLKALARQMPVFPMAFRKSKDEKNVNRPEGSNPTQRTKQVQTALLEGILFGRY